MAADAVRREAPGIPEVVVVDPDDDRRRPRWAPRARILAVLGLSVTTVSASGCSGTGGSPTPPTPIPVTIKLVTISGNGRLTAAGQTTQLSAVATMSNGSTQDVTSAVTWRTDNSNVATVSQTGLVTAVDLGQAGIWAVAANGSRLAGNSGPLTIFVLPAGTYILYGQCVQDPDHTCLAGARVEIIGGPMSGRATTTDQGGNWAFIGVGGVGQVSVSKGGYITTVQDVPQEPSGRDPIIALCGPLLRPVGRESISAIPGCI